MSPVSSSSNLVAAGRLSVNLQNIHMYRYACVLEAWILGEREDYSRSQHIHSVLLVLVIATTPPPPLLLLLIQALHMLQPPLHITLYVYIYISLGHN